MTRHSILKFAASLFAAVLAITSTAPAAHAEDLKTTVNIPFAFELGSHHFDAGKYFIISSLDGRALSLQNGSNSGVTLTMWESNNKPSAAAKVVFHHYGDRYFLREVWGAGTNEYLKCVGHSRRDESPEGDPVTDCSKRRPSHVGRCRFASVDVALLTKPN